MVSGGSSGLGLATVQLLLQHGHRVVVIDLQNASSFDGNPKCLSLCTDVCSEEQVQTAIDRTVQEFGRLDVVVNCAGIMTVKPIYDEKTLRVHEMDIFENVMKVNVFGTFNVCRLAVAAMALNSPDAIGQRGVIINTSSIAGLDGLTNTAAYSASKAAVAGMTLPLARELGKFGIRVLAVAPGPFRTPLVMDPGAIKSLIQLIPYPKRPGNPCEFAKLVLAIIENPYLNGTVLRLDAGLRGFN